MKINVKFTVPSLKIKSVADYKARAREILGWQIKQTVSQKCVGLGAIFSARALDDIPLVLLISVFSLITLPFSLVYVLLCLVELALATLLLPLFLLPVIRVLPIAAITLVWALSVAVGFWAGAPLVEE